ncbi:hypothetical protein QNH39_26395 [Neobacillus novalis]|uniref:Uncharacterized protein n=1 Tax=Neobacillus novalis TaxID=220687 RepID=A0AA95MRN5_9BACI|nr:hypothetical protein [Neobacillus novalis]WHY86061.1 hypothetical protein QNH39_26395 [Neobacillus novalis]
MKYFITILLTVVMACSFFTFSTFAEQNNSSVTIEKVNELIKKNSKENLTNAELNDIITQLKNDRIGLLEGNISSLLGLMAVLFAAVAVIAILIGWYLRRRFDDQLNKVESIKDEIKNEKDEIKRITSESDDLASQIRQTKAFLKEKENDILGIKQLFKVKMEDIDQIRPYMQYLEYMIQNHKVILDYIVERNQLEKLMSKLEGFKQTPYINHSRVILKVGQELGVFIDPNETIEDKINYLFKSANESEKDLIEEIKKFNLKFVDFYDSLVSDGVSEPHSDIDAFYHDWKHNIDSLTIILNWLNAVSIMNPQDRE